MDAPNDMRRRVLLALMSAAALPARAAPAVAGADAAAPDTVGKPLSPWHPGCLDIHHIATGRGNATFVMFPDATSLLIDAGASSNSTDVSVPTRPDSSRRAGEWIGRYVRRHLGAGGQQALDYLLVTHLHPDHTGDVDAKSPPSTRGAYRLSGVTDVAELVEVRTLIDGGYPDYDYPSRFEAPFADNYRAFVAARQKAGLTVERFRVGTAGQIAARGHRAHGDAFDVRNIAANGQC